MTILFVFLGLLPSFIWLSFFLQEDIHPEPRKMVFYVFLGGAIAAILAIFLQAIVEIFFDNAGIKHETFWPITTFAFIEEFLKFTVVFLIISKSKYFDEPIDAMVYMVTIAAGLAAVENVGVMFGNSIMPEKIGVLVLRFLGATLVHIMSSALMGFYWARGIIKNRVFIFVIFGLIMATLLHSFFNYLIVLFNGVLIYSIIFLVAAAFLVFYDFEKIKKSGSIKVNA